MKWVAALAAAILSFAPPSISAQAPKIDDVVARVFAYVAGMAPSSPTWWSRKLLAACAQCVR